MVESSSFKFLIAQLGLALFFVAAMLGVQLKNQQPLHLTPGDPQEEAGAGDTRQLAAMVREESSYKKKNSPSRKAREAVYKMSHLQLDPNAVYSDLPQLDPERSSPHSDSWDNTVAICACMFRENVTDVREWLQYHRWLGVDHVYLTENSDPPPEYLVSQLQDFIDEGFLTFRAAAQPAFQQTIYLDCMRDHRHKHNWMAFIDLDEFIVIRKKDTTLRQFMDGFKHEPALVLHWILIGPSGRERRPQEGGVLRHYSHCDKTPHPMIKSIVNTWFLLNTGGNPHNYEYRGNRRAVDEKHKPMPQRRVPNACKNGKVKSPEWDLKCRSKPIIRKEKPRSADDIALFHYVTKSKEDFMIKVERGGGDYKHRDKGFLKHMTQRTSERGGICEEGLKLAEQCCTPGSLTI